MRKSTMRDSIIYSSAMALVAVGIAVIVLGTWLTVPEDLGSKDVTVIPQSMQPLPPQRAGIGGPGEMEVTAERDMYPSNLVSLPVYSVDRHELGEVVKVSVAADGEVRHLYVVVPEFLGLGTKTVRIPATMYKRKEDRVELELTADAVNMLPEAE